MTLHRGGQAAFSVQPFQYGLGASVTAIILSAVHLSSTHWRCAPDGEVKWYLFFLWLGLRAPSPPCFSLSCHASNTKLLHTASPWLPLALSICLPTTWRTLQLYRMIMIYILIPPSLPPSPSALSETRWGMPQKPQRCIPDLSSHSYLC